MNINFEAALRYIDLENYDKAVEELNKAIDTEMEKDDESRAAEYRCVLGELLANMGKLDDARDEFATVLDYCDYSKSLPLQRRISIAFIKAIDNKLPLPDFSRANSEKTTNDRPTIGKPAQDKNFIVKQMNRRGKK